MNNPFTSSRFVSVWLKHFNSSKPGVAFDFISDLRFIKKSIFPLYINVGKNLTKGMDYHIDLNASDFRRKVFLIYDVPTYFKIEGLPENVGLASKKVFQYKGFLMNLSKFVNSEEYIKNRFSSKNRREFRSNKRRLETCFNISYEFIHGHVDPDVYKKLFRQFYNLLSNRFSEKQTNYHHLDSIKWDYYTELVYEMINEKKASLLVIFNEKKPIGITLNFHSDKILFETITVFDPDYYKFSIGKISIIKLLDWCYENNIEISDFSKGDFDYKRKWSNREYDFEYHILYDRKSLMSTATAAFVAMYFRFKLYLRERHVNELYRKFLFLSRGGSKQENEEKYSLVELTGFEASESNYMLIDHKQDQYSFLKKHVFTFLFGNPQWEKELKVYKHKEKMDYVIAGTSKTQKITFFC